MHALENVSPNSGSRMMAMTAMMDSSAGKAAVLYLLTALLLIGCDNRTPAIQVTPSRSLGRLSLASSTRASVTLY
jgi:hypothetical protein